MLSFLTIQARFCSPLSAICSSPVHLRTVVLIDAIEMNVYVESDWKKRPSDWDRK